MIEKFLARLDEDPAYAKQFAMTAGILTGMLGLALLCGMDLLFFDKGPQVFKNGVIVVIGSIGVFLWDTRKSKPKP